MAFRRPTLLTAVLGVICLAILLALGFWQLERREWKRDLQATLEERLAQPAVPLPADLGPEWEFRRVTVAGDVVPGSWFRFPGRAREGRVGEAIMLLLRDADGRLVVVEQAFVPFGEALPELPAALLTEGVLRLPAEPGWFTPANDPVANQWYAADPAAMAATVQAGPGPVLEFYLAPADWQPQLVNNHLNYAITWFSFAAIFALIFLLFHRKQPEKAVA